MTVGVFYDKIGVVKLMFLNKIVMITDAPAKIETAMAILNLQKRSKCTRIGR